MLRTDIINRLITENNYKSYLEIGIDNPNVNFNLIECEKKTAVEPFPSEICLSTIHNCDFFELTSDDFFAVNNDTYDIVFVDGLHTEEQCDKDIFNALASLNDGGCVLVHDCIPTNEHTQRNFSEYIDDGLPWNGDVWRSVIKIAKLAKGGLPVEVKIIDADYGIGVIKPIGKINYDIPARDESVSFNDFACNKNKYVDIVQADSCCFVDVFYIATGVYCGYFDNFFNTIDNFMPYLNKRVHVITDGLFDCEKYRTFSSHVIRHEILDMPYPLIPLLKTIFINNFIEDYMKYVFYFDADTIFMEKNIEYWYELLECVDNGNILMPIHPGNYYPSYEVSESSSAYLTGSELVFSVISSFWGGTVCDVKKFINEMEPLIRMDLTSHANGHQVHYIPPLFDQDYANKVVNTSNNISFLLRCYVMIDWFKNDSDRPDENFIIQKYDIERKFKTKNME